MAASSRRAAALLTLSVGAAFGAASCRSALEEYPPAPPVPECVVHADCEGFDDRCRNVRCVPDDGTGPEQGQIRPGAGGVCREVNPVDCDDGDVCTIDTCNPEDGSCSYADAAHDNDMDGFKGPREGAKAGDPDSCGDDCDDTNPEAFPGNPEVCDGADNDCNGIVDDSAVFVPAGVEPVRVSSDGIAPAGSGGLAWSGISYAATYFGTTDGFDIYRSMLAPTGEKVQPEERLTAFNSDSAGGPVVWVGDRYGVLWQERPNNDYEIFFRLLDANGQTVVTGPVQVSDGAFGFSVNPDLGWTGNHFIAVWQDEREGTFDIYGQKIDIDGNLVGTDVRLTETVSFPNEAPIVAASSQGIGVTWGKGNASSHFIQFRTFDFDLAPVSPIVELTDGTTEAVYPTVVWNEDNYVVAWFDKSADPKGIWAAVIAPDGAMIVPPRPISSPGSARSRYPSLRPLGDRLLVVYSDDRDGNAGYELYARMVTDLLAPLGAEQRITNQPGDSIYPKAAFGPEGVGILFRDDRTGEQHVWFTRLGCLAGN